jgi:hypothetical protein
MLQNFTAVALNRQVIISEENEGPVANLAAVSISNFQKFYAQIFRIYL